MKRKGKKLISVLLALLMAVTGIIPAASAFAGDGVEGYWDIELFIKTPIQWYLRMLTKQQKKSKYMLRL